MISKKTISPKLQCSLKLYRSTKHPTCKNNAPVSQSCAAWKRRPFTPTCAGAVIQCRTVLYVYVTFESWSNGVLQLEMDMQSKATLPGVGTTEQKKTTIYMFTVWQVGVCSWQAQFWCQFSCESIWDDSINGGGDFWAKRFGLMNLLQDLNPIKHIGLLATCGILGLSGSFPR